MTTDFFRGVVLLLLVADPFGNIPIFIAALREVPAERLMGLVLAAIAVELLLRGTRAYIGTS